MQQNNQIEQILKPQNFTECTQKAIDGIYSGTLVKKKKGKCPVAIMMATGYYLGFVSRYCLLTILKLLPYFFHLQLAVCKLFCPLTGGTPEGVAECQAQHCKQEDREGKEGSAEAKTDFIDAEVDDSGEDEEDVEGMRNL